MTIKLNLEHEVSLQFDKSMIRIMIIILDEESVAPAGQTLKWTFTHDYI